MKFSVCILGVISHFLYPVNSRRWSPTREASTLISVSRFEGVEKYYIQLKKALAEEDDHQLIIVSPREDVFIRQKLCKIIFRSNYFDYKQEKPVNVNNIRVQSELKLIYPATYRSLYSEYRALARLPTRRLYDNPYKLRKVRVSGHPEPFREYVFLCPVRELRSNIIKEYYISAKYNVNGAHSPNATHITGRFVFLRDPKSYTLRVHALAEEPAETVLTFDVDLMYFLRKGYNLPIEKAEDDPICQLSDLEKLRLCTALFSSARYRGRVKFIPSMDSVDPKCEKREIRFFIDVHRSHVNDTFYHEWMITCKGITLKKGKWLDLYVSRGYGPNRIFVYRWLKGKIMLYHHSVNIAPVRT